MTLDEIKQKSKDSLDKVLQHFSYSVLADANTFTAAVRVKAYDELVEAICDAIKNADVPEDNAAKDIVSEIVELQGELAEVFTEETEEPECSVRIHSDEE